ncbi:MAG: polysaccharide deacetylase family protein [Nanoarchaeota archaeon]|nr:polysaccharide deacetylase family protein [Nanoarchaeota archaeon]MBU4123993.1 polysaccharide deacetylase family protein [Nanoarchaeota archaeon]
MTKKIAYLTIDDAPSDDFKRKIDFLSSKQIPAIFFCTGKNMEKRPSEVINAIHKGFIIGNHSYNHIHFSYLSLKKCYEEIEKTDKIIDMLYEQANVKRPMKVFRFPNLDKGCSFHWNILSRFGIPVGIVRKKSIQAFLRKLGYRQPSFNNINYKWYKIESYHKDVDVYPTYDTHDWTVADKSYIHGIKNLKDILNRMDENVPEGRRGLNYSKSNDIIMLHDTSNISNLFVPMINRLLKKGIVFRLSK